MVGSIEDVGRALHILREEGPKYGLNLNEDKTEVFCPGARSLSADDQAALFQSIPEYSWNTSGVKLLGGFIGETEFIQKKVKEKVEKVHLLVKDVLELKDPHRQITLMRYCLSGYKIGHILRTTNPDFYPTEISEFDTMINDALSIILDLDFQTPALRETLGLPFNLGGMGITSASIIARASFYASRVQTSQMQTLLMNLNQEYSIERMNEAIERLNTIHQLPVALEMIDLAVPHPQRNIVRIICENQASLLPNKLPPRQRELLEARQSADYVPWLAALPSEPLGFYMSPHQLRVAVKFQFGIETRRANCEQKLCEACGSMMDPFGAHGTKCHKEGGLTKRHNVTRDTLHKAVMESGKLSEIERKEILNDGTDKRPADVYIFNYSMTQAMAVDVAVVDGATPNSIKNKEIEKRRKYLVDCANNEILFSPFVLDSFGRIGASGMKILCKLSFKYAETHDITVEQALWRLKMKMVMAMIREQSAQIIERGGG